MESNNRVSGAVLSTPRLAMLTKVLVVDDDAAIRVMLRAVLNAHGYSVRVAADGGEAFRVLDTDAPEVVLLDLMMPGVNGIDFLRTYRQHCEDRRIPTPRVVVVSAHPRMNPQELLQLGADAILTKPFNNADLITLLRHLPDLTAV